MRRKKVKERKKKKENNLKKPRISFSKILQVDPCYDSKTLGLVNKKNFVLGLT